MKNILFILGIICFIQTSANAQVENMQFGFQLSPTFSWMNSNSNQINSNLVPPLGIKIGAIGELMFNERYSFVGGMGLAFNQGGTLRYNDGIIPVSELSKPEFKDQLSTLRDVDVKYSLQYLEVPVGLKMRSNEFGYFRYYIKAPEITVGFRTKARGDILADGVDTQSEIFNDDVPFLNLFWGLGGGVEYSISQNTRLIGGLFFQQSFLDTTSDKATLADGTIEDSKGTTNRIMLQVGVMF